MLLTKKALTQILRDWRVSIPPELKKELLREYGHFITDDEGHLREYSEQDICEQLRKKLRSYQNHQQPCPNLSQSGLCPAPVNQVGLPNQSRNLG
jgi:hypothetical protein